MRVIDILTSPWAVVPDKLFEIQSIYSRHLRGEKIDIKALEAKLGQPLQNEVQGYETIDGVAVVPVDGVMSKRMNLFSKISGGASTEMIARDFRAALADPAVHAIILRIDSPGGSVDGTMELAQMIYAARGQKPIVALADGMAASAAYWVASAADHVYVSSATTAVGSIGVVATHVDYSESEKSAGIRVTEIYAGQFKRIASEHKPLSAEGRQYMQDTVDHLYSIFVTEVAKHRGSDPETVHKNMADGRIFIGQQAIDAGLVDGVSTLDQLIADMGASQIAERQRAAALRALNATLTAAPVRA